MATYEITIRARTSMDKYPAKSHARNVAEKLDGKTALVLLRGEKAETWSNSDMPRPFRQDRFFYYLSGSNDPGSWLTYNVRTDVLTLWLPRPNLERFFFDGRSTTVEEALEKYDIDEAKYIRGKKANSTLAQYVNQVLQATQGSECACMRTPAGLLGEKILASLMPTRFNASSLRAVMINCRAVKDDHELSLIRKANAISAKAHTHILESLHRLTSEAQVEATYIESCLSDKAKEQSYGPICGSGPNASQLHYMTNLEDFGDRQILLVDAGAEWQCYASDVTRTMPINPKKPGFWQSKEAEAIYECVEHIQETCIGMLGPGVKFSKVAWTASKMAIDALLRLGILKGTHDEILAAGTWTAFFPHGLGHHVGLEVHDLSPTILGDDSSTGASIQIKNDNHTNAGKFNHLVTDVSKIQPILNEAPLAPNMVVTIEPGLYFNKFALDNFFLSDPRHKRWIDVETLKRYMHVGGVRIEDDILITANGHENLTTAPKGEEMLQVIRKSAGSSTA